MKLRKNIAVITAVLMLATAPAFAASPESESESWFSWFFSLFQASENNEDSEDFSGLGRPER